MTWDPIQYAREQVCDTDPDTWSQTCRTCHRPPDRHDIACGAALYFDLPRQAHADHEQPIGPLEAAVHQRRTAWEDGQRHQRDLMRRLYGGFERLAFDAKVLTGEG